MKISSRVSSAAVTMVAIVGALCSSACPHGKVFSDSDKGFFLKIGNPDKKVYVDVKSQDDFDAALIKVKKNGGDFKIDYLCKEGANAQNDYNPERHDPCNKAAQAAESQAADRVAAGDPNATQRVQVASPSDLAAVLASFAEPSPTPSR